MCGMTALSTIIIVFAITALGIVIGKFNKFGDSDSIVGEEEQK